MTKVYHYTHSEKVLREKPRTVKPEQNIGMSNALYLLHRHAYNEDIRKLKRFPAFGFSKDHEGVDLVEGEHFRINYKCPACGGDGKETCNNPDHVFIDAMPGDIGRLGCPLCGHDPNHKVNRGKNVCPICGGYGEIIPEAFEEFGRETGYDEDPIEVAVPLEKKKQSIQSWFIISSADGSYTSYWNGLDWDGGYFLAKRYGSRNAAMEGIVKIGLGGLYKIEEIIVIGNNSINKTINHEGNSGNNRTQAV